MALIVRGADGVFTAADRIAEMHPISHALYDNEPDQRTAIRVRASTRGPHPLFICRMRTSQNNRAPHPRSVARGAHAW